MNKSNLILLSIALAVIYFAGTAIASVMFFDYFDSIFKSWLSNFEKSDMLLNIRLSLTHLLIALLPAIPISVIIVKKVKRQVFLFSLLVALPVTIPVLIGIFVSDHDFYSLIIVKDLLIMTLTPAILSWLLVKLPFFKNNDLTQI